MDKSLYAPVAVFVYKRLDKTKKCLEALEMNLGAEKTDVYIFSDGAKGSEDLSEVNEIRDFLDSYEKNHKFNKVQICRREKNCGLANSIISGVTEVINTYGKIIVVEDDLIMSQDFLIFLNDALEYYGSNEKIGEISAYTYPLVGLNKYDLDVYITRKADCWGWATWKERWDLADWNMETYPTFKNKKKDREFERLQKGINKMLKMQMKGELDSWAVRWCYSLFMNDKLTVYPRISRTVNIGFDGSGVHCGTTDLYKNKINSNLNKCRFMDLEVNEELENEAALFEYVSLLNKIINFVKRIYHKFLNKLVSGVK